MPRWYAPYPRSAVLQMSSQLTNLIDCDFTVDKILFKYQH